MRVVLVTNNFTPVIDGVGHFTQHLFTQFKQEKIDVKVVCIAGQEIIETVAAKKLQEDVFPVISKWSTGAAKKTVAIARQNGADWLVVQYVPYAFSKIGIPFHLVLMVVLARMNGIKVAVFFHEISIRVSLKSMGNSIRAMAQRCNAWLLCIGCNQLFTNTRRYQHLLKPFASVFIPIPPNLPVPSRTVSFQGYQEQQGVTVVSFLNRCYDWVLDAFTELVLIRKQHFKLVLVGQTIASHTTFIKQLIRDKQLGEVVTVYAETADLLLAGQISKADIYMQLEEVIEKYQGGISTKSGAVSFAMGCGLPIVTTKGDMTDPLFFNDETVIFTEFKNASMLADKLIFLASDKKAADQIVSNALQVYRQYFLWKNTMNHFIKELS